MDKRNGNIIFPESFKELIEKDPDEAKYFIPMDVAPTKKQLSRKPQKVGRNDPCPCGSGKKFKKCHWLKQELPMNEQQTTEELYEEWCGENRHINDCHPVHDSSETIEFAEYFHKAIMEQRTCGECKHSGIVEGILYCWGANTVGDDNLVYDQSYCSDFKPKESDNNEK